METERAEFSISELAREFDITPRAIRFYEDQGLLAPGATASAASTRRATARASS
jgi:DNA-binding transcriptional MerR regulator